MINFRSSIREVTHRLKSFVPEIPYEEKIRFAQVDQDKLYRSGWPTRNGLVYLVKRYNLRSVIRLSANEPDGEYDFLDPLFRGLNVLNLFLKTGCAPSENQIERFLSFMVNPNNQPVLIHCTQGRDRTGCLCFVYRVEQMGWSIEQAWREMKSFGFQSLPWHRLSQRQIVEWLEQRYQVKLT